METIALGTGSVVERPGVQILEDLRFFPLAPALLFLKPWIYKENRMIQRLLGPLFLLLLVALPVARGHAEAARTADLFEGLDSIRLSTAVGGPLDLEGGTTPRLFEGDLKRFNRFKQSLTDALAMKLATCGLFVDEGARDELSVELFGRPEELQQCAPRYVFMVQVKILNTKLKGRQKEAGAVSLSPVIGLADEAGLERTLIETAVAAVAGELRNCSR